MLEFERQHWARGCSRVAGVDEAGRGPLAGPVVAAAVVFEPAFLCREENGLLSGLTDSKKLSASSRDAFYELLIQRDEISWAVGSADVAEIDRLNILRATHLAMFRAVESLVETPDHILVDGLPVKGFPVSSSALVKGDSRSLTIAAASIIAKVTRDRIMDEMDSVYPDYGFAAHKGYGTALHLQRLLEMGPCPEHRMSFRPVREAAGIRNRESGGLSEGGRLL